MSNTKNIIRSGLQLTTTLFLVVLFMVPAKKVGAAPFSCDGPAVFYQTQVAIAGLTTLYALDTEAAEFTTVGNITEGINAIGYNTQDDFIYGYVGGGANDGQFVRIHDDASIDLLGVPAGQLYPDLPIGDFDHSGNHYMIVGAPGNYYLAVTTITPTLEVSYTALPGAISGINDIVYQDGMLYGLTNTQLLTIDIGLSTATAQTLTSALPTGQYGAGWATAGGEIYFSHNQSGEIYQITDYESVNPTATPVLATNHVASGNDGAACSLAQTQIVAIAAVDDENSTSINIPVSGNVLTNDTGQDITVTDYTQPTNGSVVVNPDGSYTYTPNNGFTGTDTFTYTITDASNNTTTATVVITINSEQSATELASTGMSQMALYVAASLVISATGYHVLRHGLRLRRQ